MYMYQKKQEYFAQTAAGIEPLGAAELAELGARRIRKTHRGVFFMASRAVLYRINYQARTLSRVLAPLSAFKCPDAETLYREGQQIRWTRIFDADETFAIFANVSESSITHSKFAALRLKDAIADQFRDQYNRRPDVDPQSPDIVINLHIRKDRATISFDTSGGPLHKRGYRKESVATPMQETLAGAIVRLSGWDGSRPLCDPMCGSGTLLIEAMMAYCRIPAGYLRKAFGFKKLPDFDEKTWRSIKKAADKQIRPLPDGLIFGCDTATNPVRAAETNIAAFAQGKAVSIVQSDFRNISDLSDQTIICNPPYGVRQGKRENVELLIRDFGDFMKHHCKGSRAYLYFGEREMIKRVGLRPSWKKALRNGGLDGRLVCYDLY